MKRASCSADELNWTGLPNTHEHREIHKETADSAGRTYILNRMCVRPGNRSSSLPVNNFQSDYTAEWWKVYDLVEFPDSPNCQVTFRTFFTFSELNDLKPRQSGKNTKKKSLKKTTDLCPGRNILFLVKPSKLESNVGWFCFTLLCSLELFTSRYCLSVSLFAEDAALPHYSEVGGKYSLKYTQMD